MPEIIINTDGNVPNYDALKGVAKFMLKNYTERSSGRQNERRIKTERGYILKIEEMSQDEEKSMCSCQFKVTTLSR